MGSIVNNNPDAKENFYKKSLKYLPEEKREKALEIYNLFRIIDYKGIFKELQKMDAATDSTEINNLVGKFFTEKDLYTRPDTPDKNEYREEIMKRVEYCNQYFSTPLFGDSWDMRAEAVLKIGIPDYNYKREGECWTDQVVSAKGMGKECEKFYLEWFRGNINLAYQDNNYDGVPDREIPHPENYSSINTKSEALFRQQGITNRYVKSKTKPEVYTAEGIEDIIQGVGVSVASFKEDKDEYTTYVSIGIPGNKLKDENDTAKFKCQVIIYDEKNRPVIQDSSDFSVSEKLLKVKEAWIPIYNYYQLLPGNKTVSVKVANEKDAAILLTRHQISDYKSLSDILLSESEPRIGKIKSKQQGIQRDLKNGISYVIKENPSSTFRIIDTLYTYLEINSLKPDSDKNYPYKIECLLRPLPKGKKKGEVELGPLITIGETLPDTLELEEPDKKDFSRSKEKWSYIRLYTEKKTVSDSTDYFKKALKIPETVEPGAYVLQFIVYDKTRVPKVSWRVINLKK